MEENVRILGLKADLAECKSPEFREVLKAEIDKATDSIKFSHKVESSKVEKQKGIAI
jgi:hypothetical protein